MKEMWKKRINGRNPRNWDKHFYIRIEEMTMDGPIKSVSESTPVEDPNPLPLRCSSS